jgi:prepilin-type N-terminal cleavage/methylation domain-containing protein
MDKKGFTLVELLGVLIIVSIVMLVVITPIMGQIRNNSKKLDDASLRILYSSTSSYLDQNKNSYPKNDGLTYYISVGQLIDSSNLTSNYLESYSQKVLSRDNAVKVVIENGNYQFSLADSSDNLITMNAAYQNVSKSSVYSFMGGTYFAGSVTNNYVYYSGFMWRIMGKNKDGTIKLVSDEPVTSINNGTATEYKSSYTYEWLNDYFFSRLKYSDFIVPEPSCYEKTSSASIKTDACVSYADSALDFKSVSLLSLNEYNLSYYSSQSYLNNNIAFSTLTYSSVSTNLLYYVQNNGTVSTKNVNLIHYIRPVINLMPETIISAGNGTSSSPYVPVKLTVTASEGQKKSLSSVNLADGEYINVKDKIYRVVESDNSEVKIILNDLYKISGSIFYTTFGSTSTFNTTDGVGRYLNTDFYNMEYTTLNGKIKNTLWYQGDPISVSPYYKNSFLAKTNFIYSVTTGLPKACELLTVPIYGNPAGEFWTMSKETGTTIYSVTAGGINASLVSASLATRPVAILDASSLLIGGNGTSISPYIVER